MYEVSSMIDFEKWSFDDTTIIPILLVKKLIQRG